MWIRESQKLNRNKLYKNFKAWKNYNLINKHYCL